jgi:hypothetical protein
MRRSLAPLLVASAAILAVSACESPTAVTVDPGPVVALDSLRAADAAGLPCCAFDSAGARVTLMAGTLTFQAYPHYTDTVFTPAGPKSAACVTGVPNGAEIHENGLVTVGDSVAYLVIPCHVGTYTLALAQRLEFADGSSRTANVTVSSGTYAWQRDTLSLAEEAGQALAATMSVDTIIVAAVRHTYKFQAVAAY